MLEQPRRFLDIPSQVVVSGVSVVSADQYWGHHICSHMEQLVVFTIRQPQLLHLVSNWNWKWPVGTATIDDFGLYGGTVQSLAITTEGKFYTSAPTVIIGNPGFSFVSAS